MMTKTKENAKKEYTILMRKTKKDIFSIYKQRCLGRINNVIMAEQKKSWMAYDIVKSYGYPEF